MGRTKLGWGPAVNIAHKRRLATATAKVRNAAAIASVLVDLGADPANVLRKAGVEPETFANLGNTLPYAALGRLTVACAEATGCDDFGLQVGIRSEPTIMGLTGIVSISSPTVRDGIGVILATLRTTDTGGEAFLSVRLGLASFGYTVVAPEYRGGGTDRGRLGRNRSECHAPLLGSGLAASPDAVCPQSAARQATVQAVLWRAAPLRPAANLYRVRCRGVGFADKKPKSRLCGDPRPAARTGEASVIAAQVGG